MNNMDNLDGDKIIEEAEKSLERLSRKIEQLEYDSKRDVLKHFDRLLISCSCSIQFLLQDILLYVR